MSTGFIKLAEREGFEPSGDIIADHFLSREAQ